MYLGVFFREIPWLFGLFILIGFLPMILSFVIYFWVGLVSTRTVTVQCPNCENYTKILGKVDYCQVCKEPLTLDQDLEGKEFNLDYNVDHRLSKLKEEENTEQKH